MVNPKQLLHDIDLSWLRSLSYLWLVPPALLIGGIQGLYSVAMYPAPVTYTMDDYLRDRPTDKWLLLTHAEFDIENATSVKIPLIGLVTDVYIPVFTSQASTGDCPSDMTQACPLNHSSPSIQLLVTTTNRQIIEHINDAPTQNQPSPLHEQPGTVSGMAKFGIEGLTSDRRRWLGEQYGDRLVEDAVVIDLNAQPHVGRSIICLIGGTALSLWLLQPRLRKF